MQPDLNTYPTMKYANAHQVAERLWIGGDLAIQDPGYAHLQLNELDKHGITDIMDLRLEWNDHDWVTAEKPHLNYFWHGEDDIGQLMPDEWFDSGTDYALRRLAEGATILSHCHMGINRGPSMGYAIMLTLGWDPIEALDRIRTARPIAYVGYAEDALDWWLRKKNATDDARKQGQEKLQEWRWREHLDLETVIRKTRDNENM